MSNEWQEPNSDAIDIKKEEPNGEGKYPEHVGVYNEFKTYPSSFDPTKLSYLYKFTDLQGNIYSMFGFTVLNRYMEAVPIGSLVRIYYTGKGKNKKGQDMHTCKVFYKKVDAVESTGNDVEVKADDDLPF